MGMIKGYIQNATGRYKHIFKRNMGPGQKVDLSDLYTLYEKKYDGEFDLDFVKWVEENKIIPGFNLVVEEYEEEELVSTSETSVGVGEIEAIGVGEVFSQPAEKNFNAPLKKKVTPNRLTSTEISELKIKDDPKRVISQVQSIHKLRRALTECKGKKGKGTLIKYIQNRIAQLNH